MKFSIKLLGLMALALFSSFTFAQDNGEYAANYARAPRFKALLHYEPHAEEAHVQFDKQAIEFFHKLTYGEGWLMDVTTSLADYPYEKLKEYSIIVSLNAAPGGAAQREAFEKYMENGGGWMGLVQQVPRVRYVLLQQLASTARFGGMRDSGTSRHLLSAAVLRGTSQRVLSVAAKSQEEP